MARKKKTPAMTALQWDTGTDWKGMLDFIKGTASPRKIRLFGVACCRRIAHLFHVKTCGKAVDVAERYADGFVTENTLYHWWDKVGGLKDDGYELGSHPQFWRHNPAFFSAKAVYNAVSHDSDLRFDGGEDIARHAAGAISSEVIDRLGRDCPGVYEAASEAGTFERAAQLALTREVFGNPFLPVAFDLIWRSEAVVGLATGIYDDKAFERLPILADALEEAGCNNADIVSHCREPGVHVRGCWVIDLVLGKA